MSIAVVGCCLSENFCIFFDHVFFVIASFTFTRFKHFLHSFAVVVVIICVTFVVIVIDVVAPAVVCAIMTAGGRSISRLIHICLFLLQN